MVEQMGEIAAMAKAAEVMRQRFPAMLSGLNVAQYRALERMYTPDGNGELPALNIFSFANGVGKTHMLVLDMIGWTLGPEFLNWRKFPPAVVKFYDSLGKLRDKGLLSLRLVCNADDMKPDGSMLMIIKTIFPMAQVSSKDQSGCHRLIEVPHPRLPDVKNSIIVKTFDQDVVKHSGSNCNRIWINEPLPDNLVGETVGRIRSKAGELQGSIMMCATLLSGATWVQKLEDDRVMRVNHVRGHIYENCVGESVTDRMAAEVRESIGVTLERAEDGRGYVTNGVLSETQINAMLSLWQSTSPHELEARKSGAPISGGGRIWPGFNKAYHIIGEYKLNSEWPVIMVADPHGSRPTMILWAQVSPLGRLYVFKEWPDADHYGFYDTITSRIHTIPQECEIWARMEMGLALRGASIHRIGDPNRFKDHQSYTGETLYTLYAKHGFGFDLSVNDNLAVGHATVAEYLSFDEGRMLSNPCDLMAMPRLLISEECPNIIRAVENYAFKIGNKVGDSVTERVNQKYKDGADLVRYLCMWHAGRTFAEMRDGDKAECSDYVKWQRGRTPNIYRDAFHDMYGYGKGTRMV